MVLATVFIFLSVPYGCSYSSPQHRIIEGGLDNKDQKSETLSSCCLGISDF